MQSYSSEVHKHMMLANKNNRFLLKITLMLNRIKTLMRFYPKDQIHCDIVATWKFWSLFNITNQEQKKGIQPYLIFGLSELIQLNFGAPSVKVSTNIRV